jgi:hypothetical protein
LLQENEGDGGESQTEGDLSDLAELSVNGPGSVDVKKEIGVKGIYHTTLSLLWIRIRIQQFK